MDDPELLFHGDRFRVVRKVRRMPDGSSHVRQIIHHPGAVVLLPMLDDGRVVLIRNYRMSIDDYLIELPAGTLEPGEDALGAARRELAEETGFRARSIELLTHFYASPGILDERLHLFLAEGLEAGPSALDAGEEIELLAVPWEDALAMARDGRIKDAKTLVGLLYYEMVRDGRRA